MKIYKSNKNILIYLPNLLSLLRIIIAVLLFIKFYVDNEIDIIFVFLFSLAVISDKLDGYYAKKLNATTNLGKLLDPLADKILAFIIMIILYKKELLPIWAICISISKDISLSLYRYIMLKKGIVVSALKLGRYKTAYNLLVFEITLIVLMNIQFIDRTALKLIKLMLITTIL